MAVRAAEFSKRPFREHVDVLPVGKGVLGELGLDGVALDALLGVRARPSGSRCRRGRMCQTIARTFIARMCSMVMTSQLPVVG